MLSLPDLRDLPGLKLLAGGDHPAPAPPPGLPPGRLVDVPGRGELFLRDTGPEGAPAVLLLHGWMFPADLNWFGTYRPLQKAGFRVLALDHRGHGRGLRSPQPFRLADCADDAIALLDAIGVDSATLVGYSMGGPIAALAAERHPDKVDGIVLCATAMEWKDPWTRAFWQTMGGLRLLLGLAPNETWRAFLRLGGFPDSPMTSWTAAELSRGSAKDVAEAGRELSRFDARPWIGDLQDVPSAVLVTTEDKAVPPAKQRRLAGALGARTFPVEGDHMAVTVERSAFNRALLAALRHVARSGAAARTAAA